MMNFLLADATTTGAETTGMTGMIGGTVLYLVFFGVIIYFLIIRPQKKQEKERTAIVNSVAVGDSILTTSGFYGIVINIQDDMVIVEFGNNKNCRIPMQKSAIVEVEKPQEA